jgi:hypothetical protein
MRVKGELELLNRAVAQSWQRLKQTEPTLSRELSGRLTVLIKAAIADGMNDAQQIADIVVAAVQQNGRA